MEFKHETQKQERLPSAALSSLIGAPVSLQALEKAVPPEKLASFAKAFGTGGESGFWKRA